MKKVVLSLTLLFSLMLLSGCMSMGPKTPAEFVKGQADKEMSAAFSKYMGGEDDYYFSNKRSGFTLKKTHIGFTGSKVDRSTAISYIKRLKLEKDELAKLYKEVLEKRGSSYTVYKGVMNNKIYEEIVGGKLSGSNGSLERYYYHLTPAIIEYDSEGRMKSALLRNATMTIHPVDRTGPYAPVKIEIETLFIDSNKVYTVESSIDNNEFSKYEIYSSKKDTPTSSNNSVASSGSPSKAAQIKELHALYKDGAITEAEYKAEKEKILSSSRSQSQHKSVQKSASITTMFEQKIINNYNKQHGTNFTSMQQIQEANRK